MSNSGQDQIRGWKEIASYFGRDERTVKRWEKQRALPVRRIPGEGRANVYIVISEAETWLANGNHVADSPTAGRNGPVPADDTPAHASTAVGIRFHDDTAPDHYAALDRHEGTGYIEAAGMPAQRESASRENHTRALVALLVGSAVLVLAATVLRGHVPARGGASAQPHASHMRYATPDKANALYLQGVYFNEQRTPADLNRALNAFQGAISLDPDHAHAYAGLAITYLLLREYGTMPEDYAYFKAEVAAQRALALDPNVPEAHASLGFIAFFSGWNSQVATSEFTTALRLNSSCVLAHHWYGSMLTHQGRFVEALQQLEMAQQLEPTSAAILSSKAYALGLSGRRDEAMELLQPLVTGDRAIASPHRILAILSLLPPRDIPRYLSEARQFAEIRHSNDTIATLTYGAAVFHRGGERAMWAAMLAKEKEQHPSADRPTYLMAEMEAALGLEDEATREIAILAKQHDAAIIGIAIDPLFNPLHHNPRFQQIEVSVGLAPRA